MRDKVHSFILKGSDRSRWKIADILFFNKSTDRPWVDLGRVSSRTRFLIWKSLKDSINKLNEY